MRRPLLVVLASCAALVVGASAAAAAKPVTVASAPDGRRLQAFGDGHVCVRLAASRVHEYAATSCGPVSSDDVDAGLFVTAQEDEAAPALLAGAVPAAGVRVEVRLDDGSTATVATVPGEAYRGRDAGRVRFFVLSLPRGRTARRVFLHDATDGVIRVEDLDAFDEDRVADAGPVVLGTARFGGRRVTVRADVRSEAAPTAVDPAHRTPQVCLVIRRSHLSCSTPDRVPELGSTDSAQECRPRVDVLSGFTDPGTRTVTGVLGDGRRLAARLLTLPPALGAGALRAWVLDVPPALALRRIEFAAADATRISEVGNPPLTSACRSDTSEFLGIAFFVADIVRLVERGFAGTGQSVAISGPPVQLHPAQDPALEVADAQDGRLCLAFARTTFTGGDCGAPGLGEGTTSGTFERGSDGRTRVAIVTRERVARVRVRFRSGVVLTLDPLADDAYTGPYRGRVRFFAASAPASTGPLEDVVRLDASGRRVGPAEADPGRAAMLTSVRRVVGLPGNDLYAARTRVTGAGGSAVKGLSRLCLALAPSSAVTALSCLLQTPEDGEPAVRVTCAGRATIVYGLVAAGTRTLHLETTSGTRAVRLHRLPPALGARRFYAAVLPARVGLRSFVALQRSGKRLTKRYALPPARAQCGYSA